MLSEFCFSNKQNKQTNILAFENKLNETRVVYKWMCIRTVPIQFVKVENFQVCISYEHKI